MPDAAPDAPPPPPAVPPWLEPATLWAMREAVDRALAWDRTVYRRDARFGAAGAGG